MKIVTDCAADMPPEEIEMLGVTQAPLYIQFPEGEVSSAGITPDEFYTRLAATYPSIPTTAQPSSGDFREIYRTLAETDKDIFSVHISAGLSGTINGARMGAQQVAADVTIWDTMTLSGAQRFQVLAAAMAAAAGWDIPAIQERLTEIRAHTEIVFTLETLEYLARGGRIGRVQGMLGALLNIKPIIHVAHSDGKYSTVGKNRTISQALTTIASHLREMYAGKPVWVTVEHGYLAEKAAALAGQLSERLNVARLETLRVSPVLGVHTGPGIVGAAVVPMELMAGLIS